MPRMNFEWLPHYFKRDDILELCQSSEEYLRHAIKVARPPVNHEYKVMIRGNPHPNIAIGIPDLEICVEYHEDNGDTSEDNGDTSVKTPKTVV